METGRAGPPRALLAQGRSQRCQRGQRREREEAAGDSGRQPVNQEVSLKETCVRKGPEDPGTTWEPAAHGR